MNKREETYHMTEKEMVRLKVAERLLEGHMKIDQAARVLMLSTRQIIRIKERVRRFGPSAAVHGNRARKPINATDDNVKDLVVELKRHKYQGANFSHFCELLSERENITLSQPTVHRILSGAGLKSPKKKKKVRVHHYRKRMDCPGAMVQLDASPYPWLGDVELALHGAIDDASGDILGLYFCSQECLEGYFEITRQMIKGPGIPVSIYTDKHTILFSPKRARLTIEDQLEGKTEPYTQFSAAASELGINMIAAGSPQAKGRIERLWGTLQDRLVQEFLINEIKDIDSANVFMKEYIPKFNRRFSVIAKGSSVFRKLAGHINIDHILCRKYTRKLDNGSAFSYGGNYWQLLSGGKPAAAIPRSAVKVLTSQKIGIKAEYSGKVYSLARIEKPQAKSFVKTSRDRKIPAKPADSHPWKSGNSDRFKYDSRDRRLYEGLYNSTISWETEGF
ncbi:MAG: ISNCY family transposase [Actinobacteria bacterium]|nr:ISNCY family transposase [Actinomycetota bacterium]